MEENSCDGCHGGWAQCSDIASGIVAYSCDGYGRALWHDLHSALFLYHPRPIMYPNISLLSNSVTWFYLTGMLYMKPFPSFVPRFKSNLALVRQVCQLLSIFLWAPRNREPLCFHIRIQARFCTPQHFAPTSWSEGRRKCQLL